MKIIMNRQNKSFNHKTLCHNQRQKLDDSLIMLSVIFLLKNNIKKIKRHFKIFIIHIN